MFLLIVPSSEPPGSFRLFSSGCLFFCGEANGLKFPSTLRCGCVLNSVSKDDSCCVTPRSPPTSTLRITQMTSVERHTFGLDFIKKDQKEQISSILYTCKKKIYCLKHIFTKPQQYWFQCPQFNRAGIRSLNFRSQLRTVGFILAAYDLLRGTPHPTRSRTPSTQH